MSQLPEVKALKIEGEFVPRPLWGGYTNEEHPEGCATGARVMDQTEAEFHRLDSTVGVDLEDESSVEDRAHTIAAR